MPETFLNQGGIPGGAIPSTDVTGLSSQQVLFGSAAGMIAQNSSFTFDGTNLYSFAHQASTGTTAAVSYGLRNAPNTGWNFATTNTAELDISGLQAVVVNSSGQVGIGTTAPTGTLHLVTKFSSQALHMQTVSGGGTSVSDLTLGFQSSAGNSDAVIQATINNLANGGNLRLNPGGGTVVVGTTVTSIGFFGTTGSTQASSYTVPSTAVFTTVSRSIATTISTNSTNLTPWGFPSSVAFNSWQNAIIELQQVVSNLVRDFGQSQGGYGLMK